MVDRQQQALLAGRAVHQHRAQQRPLFEVEAALGLGEQLGAFVEGLHRNVPEQFLFAQRTMLRQPFAVDLAERQAQGIMLFDQALQGLAQQAEVNGLPRLQQQRLVPVFAARQRQVWCWNRSRGLKWMPSWRARLTTWIDRIESPPSSKKLSPRPTRSTFSTSRQTPASCCSSTLRGAS